MVDGGPPGSVGAYISGWMTRENFFLFLKHFVKHCKPTVDDMDNHESHVSLESIQYAKENGIHMLSFHSHYSHRLQPLDRSVFFSQKRHYNVQCNAWLSSHPGRPNQPLYIPAVCCYAFKLVISPANIQTCLKSTVIFPFNPF
ncbi:uncharacterized protein LOC124817131 [Hydra vulgaris]|uniref:uncharacterized protein LOC124817131 n=1 Tax=Hydra vulgaris TaxID=6087 RepID=UPI001F5ECE9F|nr:MFS-type transporter clz9-like [Hydra vulgaris]